MLLEHADVAPQIDSGAWVAPDATVCGDVRIARGARILHGARIVAEAGSRIEIGQECIVMENAVVRAAPRHPCTIADNCLIGPVAHVVGATVEEQVFIATGAAVFHGARIGRRSTVRIHATVHIKTALPEGATVPIGWVAVGDPARILSPDKHDEIWEVQRDLHFQKWVYDVDRGTPDLLRHITRRLSVSLGRHGQDRPLDRSPDQSIA